MPNITKAIYTLTRPVWLDASGMDKGINHDRQHLGIILAAGEVLTIRQSNTSFSEPITLRLLNDDRKTEATFSISNSWTEVSHSTLSVPFIDTPYLAGLPEVEFSYSENNKTLPVYCENGDQAAFFSVWDKQDAEFGLIEAEYNRLLVPKVSLTDLKDLDIETLLAHYKKIFSFYNTLTGLSFEPERNSDRNIKNRYFMKADINGAGAAYYTNTWTAETSNSVSGFWLSPHDTTWGSLHEIAHGYQGYFMQDNYFSTGEVWNNIYAACYQANFLGDRKYQQGWLYDYGNKEKVEQQLMTNIENSIPLNQWDLRLKLYFIMLMLDKAGNDSFTYFNQQYRLISNTAGFIAKEHLLLDMLSSSFANVGRQVDVTPFVLLAGGYLSLKQRNINAYSNKEAVYPLCYLVNAGQLETVKGQLQLASSLDLVTVGELKTTGLTGNVNINLHIDDFTQIEGGELTLLDGESYVYKARVGNPTLEINDLPIGVYNLQLPTGKDQKYQPGTHYLVVKQGQSIIDIQLDKKMGSSIASQEIKLLGISDEIFATVIVDQAQGKLVIDVSKTTPHPYWPKLTYSKIIIRDAKGNVSFIRDIQGTEVSLSHDEINFAFDDQIEIYHAEPNRLILNPTYQGIIDNKRKTNVFNITKTGLKNLDLQNDSEQSLLVQITNAVTQLRGFPKAHHAEYSPFKDDIYLAIKAISSPLSAELMLEFQDCIPSNNEKVVGYIGNEFTITAKGINDFQFLTATLDLQKQTLMVKLASGIPHNRYPDIYASLVYQDTDANILFSLDVLGSKNQQEKLFELPLSINGSEVIRLHHEEPKNRLVITNDRYSTRLIEQGKQQNYRITTTGIERITD